MSLDSSLGTCLSDAEIAAFAADPARPENEQAASHIFVCDDCAGRFEARLSGLDAPVVLTDEEKAAVKSFVEQHCHPVDILSRALLWVAQHPAAPRKMSWTIARPKVPLPFGRMSSGASDWRNVAARPPSAVPSPRRDKDNSESVTFVYLSTVWEEDKALAWRADLTLSGDPDDETRMRVTVLLADRSPARGVFSVGGMSVPLKDGHGELLYRDFVKGLKTAEATLIFPDGARSDGTLAIF